MTVDNTNQLPYIHRVGNRLWSHVMLEIMPYVNWSLIAALLGTTAFQAFRINRLEDKVRRLDTILSTHLALDPRYIKKEDHNAQTLNG